MPTNLPTPPKAPDLTELRKEIDRIDESMHRLLMERGDIIDRLIAVKKSQDTGSAFRPAREAEMMRRLVKRHKGILPLDTVESIWRVIIATFTYVQAPFSAHADFSAGDASMRDSARFHFGFTVPLVPHMGAAAVVAAVSNSKGDLGLVPAIASAGAWWTALEFDAAPKIIARLPFVERADFLLDLHSMHDDCVPLMLCGPLDRGVVLAQKLGAPVDIVRDRGHAAGTRMRDYGAFGDPKGSSTALLIETGQHWRASSVTVAKDVTARFLIETGTVDESDLPADWKKPTPPKQRVVQVTHAVATKRGNFVSARRFEGQEVIAKAGTVLGHDDGEPVTTPYDNCVLVMPSINRPLRAGVTVVRLGRLI